MSPFSPFGAGRVATVLPRHHRHRPHHHHQHWQHWWSFLWGVGVDSGGGGVFADGCGAVLVDGDRCQVMRRLEDTSNCWLLSFLSLILTRFACSVQKLWNRIWVSGKFVIKDIETIEATSKPASEWVGFGKDYGSWTLECHWKGDLTPTVFMSEEHSFSDFRLHSCLSAR